MSDDLISREPTEYQYSPVDMHSMRRWSGEMSVIVLDTSVLVKDPFGKGAGFHALHAACLVMRGLIAIPAVVIEELIANYRDKLRDAFRKLAPLTRESVSQSEAERHRDFLAFVDELRQKRTILPYPQISHQAIVERIYEGKRPFHNGEVGYKDFLIWRSVVELLAIYNEQSTRVVLISANVADFAASKGDPNSGLHSEYLDEVTAADRKRLSYFTSVESYTRSVLGDGFADFAKEQPDGANALRLKHLPRILNTFLVQNRPDRRYATYEADDLDFSISYVQELPDGLFAVSGIMDFMPCWHANSSDQQLTLKDYRKSDALIGDNNWDAHVTLIVDQQLRVLKADIDGEAVAI